MISKASEFSSAVSSGTVNRNSNRRMSVFAVLAAGIALSGCTRIEDGLAAIPVFSFLREAPFFDPYEAPRPAPVGAIPYITPNGIPDPTLQPTEASLTAWGAAHTNPVPMSDTLAMQVGQVMYDRHCGVCHGPQGNGDGPIIGPGKFPFAPNLHLPVTVARTDGYLYGVIAAGRGLMPAYGPRMTPAERWATVNYIRQLQSGAGAAAAQQAQPQAPAAAQQNPGSR